MTDIQATLDARKAVYGDFTEQARIAEGFKDIAHGSPSWGKMSPVQRLGIDMLLCKIARACAGDPNHSDTWHDVAGYARLIEERVAPPVVTTT